MSLSDHIIYSSVHVYRDQPSDAARIVTAVDIMADGKYHYHYFSKGKDHFLSGKTCPDLFHKFNEAIPEGIFHPELATICRSKFIFSDTKTIERMTLERIFPNERTGEAVTEKTVLEWDAKKLLSDLPLPILKMETTFHKILSELRPRDE
jgi:hypothetical protein